jgi:hypothetical protein
MIGTAALHGHTCKEVNLDGTPKMPYRHPHFGHVTTMLPHNTRLDGQHAPPLPNVQQPAPDNGHEEQDQDLQVNEAQ